MNELPTGQSSDKVLDSGEPARAADAVFWSGAALAGFFAVNTVLAILPPALLQPDWQLKLALTLQANGLQSLIGCAMMSAAPLLDPGNRALRNRAERIRLMAAWICVGWLLLIPLQISSGIRLLNQSQSAVQLELRQRKQQIDQLQQTKDEQNFRLQFALMSPTSPPFPEQLPASLERVRAEAVSQFIGQWRRQQDSVSQILQDRLQAFLVQNLGNGLLCLMLMLGFAAIGRWRAQGPTLLSRFRQGLDPKQPGSLVQQIQAGLKNLRRGSRQPITPQQTYPSMVERWRSQLHDWVHRYQRRRQVAQSKAATGARQRRHQAAIKQTAAKARKRR